MMVMVVVVTRPAGNPRPRRRNEPVRHAACHPAAQAPRRAIPHICLGAGEIVVQLGVGAGLALAADGGCDDDGAGTGDLSSEGLVVAVVVFVVDGRVPRGARGADEGDTRGRRGPRQRAEAGRADVDVPEGASATAGARRGGI